VVSWPDESSVCPHDPRGGYLSNQPVNWKSTDHSVLPHRTLFRSLRVPSPCEPRKGAKTRQILRKSIGATTNHTSNASTASRRGRQPQSRQPSYTIELSDRAAKVPGNVASSTDLLADRSRSIQSACSMRQRAPGQPLHAAQCQHLPSPAHSQEKAGPVPYARS